MRLIHAGNGVQQKPNGLMTFQFVPGKHASGPSGIGQGMCGSAQAFIGRGTMRFVQPFIFPTTTDCGPTLGVSQTRFVDAVLSGTVEWTINGGRLVITKNGNKLELEAT